jgi:hypothetical protein
MKSKLSCLFLLLAAPLLHAQSTPSLMSYQGRVTDGAGVLIGNTSPVNRTVTFRLYTASSGGAALYAETQTVTISGGEFSVLIGNGSGITGSPGPSAPASTPYKTLSDIINSSTYGSLYLGITVDDGTAAVDPEIAPRQQMVSGVFALRSKVAESVAGGAVTTTMIGDGQVSTGKIASGAVDSSRILDSSIVSTDIANNTITAGKLDTTTIGLWTPQGSSVYRSSGNVGIGEANPGFPLNFASSMGDKIALYGNTGATFGIGIQASLLQIHSDTSTSDIAFGYGSSSSSTSFTERMRVKGNGNVGIGASAPSEKLSIQDGKLWFTTASGNGDNGGIGGTMASNDFWRIYGFGSDNNSGLYIDTYDDAAEPIVFRQVAGSPSAVAAFYERMRIHSNGYVGIGTSSPSAPLHVASYGFNTYTIYAVVDSAAAPRYTNSFGSWDTSIIADHRIRGSAFDSLSDLRIKNVQKVSDGDKDLSNLMKIQITDYLYRDLVNNSNKPQKKVIAQQLETVYPQAVSQSTGVVPDIYQKATAKDGWIVLATDLKKGDRVKLIGDKEHGVHEVLEIAESKFRTDFKAEGNVFVYGREVNDFRSVDYDAISMLNVSATQELAKKLEEKDAVIAALEARLSALEKRVSAAK